MRSVRALAWLPLLCLAAGPAAAGEWPVRPLPAPVPRFSDSGTVANAAAVPRVVHEQLVRAEGAAWLRVYFGDVRLEDRSFLRLTSLGDGEVQVLDAAALAAWHNTSAYFNGDGVRVELVAAPGTTGNRLVIEQVASEAAPALPTAACGICGADDRVLSSELWAARLLPMSCTASVWNEDSCALSAGHCMSADMVLEFHVPFSSPACALNHPPVTEQFPVTSFLFANGGVGNDWSVMTVGTNDLGQRPFDRYGQFRPIAGSPPQAGQSLGVWGYGQDEFCPEFQVQQTSGGQVASVSSLFFKHDVDATFGSSGSGVLRDGQEILGIATHCPCPNSATRVDHPGFAAARAQLCPTAGPEPATLTSVQVVAGTLVAGGVGELAASDDQHLVIEAAHQGIRYNAIVDVTAQSPELAVSELSLDVELGGVGASPVYLILQLYNFDLGKYDNLSISVASAASETVKTHEAVANPNAYVDVAGEIRLRLVLTARDVQTPGGFTAPLDRVAFTVTPE
jgi:hypothetical protein